MPKELHHDENAAFIADAEEFRHDKKAVHKPPVIMNGQVSFRTRFGIRRIYRTYDEMKRYG